MEILGTGAEGYFDTDGTTLFWSAPEGPSRSPAMLWARPLAGGPSVKLLQVTEHAPVAVDPSGYYFSASGVFRLPR